MWAIETLDEGVDGELEALPTEVKARFARVCGLIQQVGLENVGEPHVKHLQGKLWEMRLKGRDGIARALYVTATGRRVVIVRAFVKKTQKAPRREIELALERAGRVK
jgi:phage-related protein